MLFFRKKTCSEKVTGNTGENFACNYLRKNGYRILTRNFRNHKGRQLGEIDIIGEKDGVLVFFEVKTRRGIPGKAILPENNITPSKLIKMNKIAHVYLKINQLWDQEYRFDALSVYVNPLTNESTLKHLKNIYF